MERVLLIPAVREGFRVGCDPRHGPVEVDEDDVRARIFNNFGGEDTAATPAERG